MKGVRAATGGGIRDGWVTAAAASTTATTRRGSPAVSPVASSPSPSVPSDIAVGDGPTTLTVSRVAGRVAGVPRPGTSMGTSEGTPSPAVAHRTVSAGLADSSTGSSSRIRVALATTSEALSTRRVPDSPLSTHTSRTSHAPASTPSGASSRSGGRVAV